MSPAGCGSPTIVWLGVTAVPSGEKPCVWPEMRLTRPDGRRAEVGVVRVVAHREVLRVVPHGGDHVAVVVAHHRSSCRRSRCRACDEVVHEPAVVGALLVRVVVILRVLLVLRAVEPERLRRVWVVRREQRLVEAVHRRRVVAGCEGRLARRVRRDRIRREVVVEGHVLLKDHDDVLDRRRRVVRRGRVRLVGCRGARHMGRGPCDRRHQRKRQQREDRALSHAVIPPCCVELTRRRDLSVGGLDDGVRPWSRFGYGARVRSGGAG